ncbi:hypothetical protein B0H11DRAFT_2127959 [Mycena galericulata]|nr:hypothetical protein B0H11DRAFT_2127959 [Mycena galericulata]
MIVVWPVSVLFTTTMPKAKTSTRAGTQGHVIFTDGKKRVVIPRPQTYGTAIDAVRRHFPAISRDRLVFQTDQLDICDGSLADIAPESWESVVELVSSIFVGESRETHQCAVKGRLLDCSSGVDSSETITLEFLAGEKHIYVRMKMHAKIWKIFRRYIANRLGCDPDESKIIWDGQRVQEDDTPASIEADESEPFLVSRELIGGKPVIYLYSPTEMDVSVALTLTRDWRFSAVYPVVESRLQSTGGEKIHWNVRTHVDGNLTETDTGLDVAYLFWEAHTNLGVPMSPPASPVLAPADACQSFSPLISDLSPTNSVLLAVSDITPYLDKALVSLGLHTEARTSFITYWLPSFLKHTHVALRFVPQAAYETSATLDIHPRPDIVTRVFMLFKGVPAEKVSDWDVLNSNIEDAAARWSGIVGVDLHRALDTSLFRVLEWGGMEVLGR